MVLGQTLTLVALLRGANEQKKLKKTAFLAFVAFVATRLWQ
jgi:hypothetical protein